jgi:hypothetical protein
MSFDDRAGLWWEALRTKEAVTVKDEGKAGNRVLAGKCRCGAVRFEVSAEDLPQFDEYAI